jgi:hypothetical protein
MCRANSLGSGETIENKRESVGWTWLVPKLPFAEKLAFRQHCRDHGRKGNVSVAFML